MYFKNLQKIIWFFSLILFFCIKTVFSQEFTSTSYKVIDPVMNAGGYGSSSNFKLFGVISQMSIGTSTSLSFGDNSGFLYFPFASTPSVSTTPGNGQVSLSWTLSTGYLGWSASGYSVGQATVSGGPYTYTSLGNVNSSIRTGLTNSTTYYFVILVKDFFGNSIATSTEVSATPSGPITPPSGGGGGGGITVSETGVIFSGRAYPLSKVTFLKDGQLALSTIAGPDSKFEAKISNLTPGDYTFSVYGEDKSGLRSSHFTFSISITSGALTRISGIFIAPTIAVDKSEVKRGDDIIIFGQSSPSSEIIINVNSENEFFEKVSSDKDGIYLRSFDTSVLEIGNHTTKSKASLGGEISSFSNTVGFKVGTKNVTAKPVEKVTKCDLNEDGRCNLVDFSIAAYWYKRTLSTEFIPREKKHLNGDGKVDLVDFSIMAYYWTG